MLIACSLLSGSLLARDESVSYKGVTLVLGGIPDTLKQNIHESVSGGTQKGFGDENDDFTLTVQLFSEARGAKDQDYAISESQNLRKGCSSAMEAAEISAKSFPLSKPDFVARFRCERGNKNGNAPFMAFHLLKRMPNGIVGVVMVGGQKKGLDLPAVEKRVIELITKISQTVKGVREGASKHANNL